MGAEFWEHLVRYEPDPSAALLRLQAEVFESSGVDFYEVIRDRTDELMAAIRAHESGDDLGQLETYRICLDDLHQLAAEGMPPTVEGRVRRLQEVMGIGFDRAAPGILGVEGLACQPEYYQAYCPLDWQAEEICGTPYPTAREARIGVRRLGNLKPGMAICLLVYEESWPICWYFAGYSFD